MQQRSWKMRLGGMIAALSLALTITSPALAEDAVLKKGTDVKLAFDSSMSSKTAKPGDVVKLHVVEPVAVDGQVVIAEGTHVTGKITKVSQRQRYGVNAKIQLKLDPIKMVDGNKAEVGYKTKSSDSSRTGTAAGATIGGAAVLGPLGLAAGYFVVGKSVSVKPGDKMTVEIANDTTVAIK